MSAFEAVARWYVVLVACTWAFAPLVRWLCPALPDRGATIARPLALLGVVYPAWLVSSLGILPFGAAPLVVTLVAAAALGWGVLLRQPGRDLAWVRTLAWTEIASLGLFVVYVWFRGFTPEILNTEKPMDVAFLASSARSVVMPPPDPWFAGQPINYYYLGYLLQGSIARLAGVAAPVAFNLALATIFSMTAVASFGVAWNVVRPWLGRLAAAAAGGLAMFGVVLAGNLYAPLRLVADPATVWSAWWWDSEGVGWRASRIVCDGVREGFRCPAPAVETINEFPAFSFILGDLHPHLMALPFAVAVVALAWNILASPEGSLASGAWMGRLAISAAIAGALYALNAWDLPTYLGLVLLAALLVSGPALATRLRTVAIVVVAALVPWLPFFATYRPPVVPLTGVEPAWLAQLPVVSRVMGLVSPYLGVRTSAGEYVTMFGVPYLVGLVLVLDGVDWQDARRTFSRPVVISLVSLAFIAVLLAAPVVLICGAPLVLALRQLTRNHEAQPKTFALAMFSAAWLLSVLVEFVFIRDLFGNRMNTLFKFYYQAWTLSALGAAVGLVVLARAYERSTVVTWMLRTATAAVLVLGLAYPVIAGKQWTDGFSSWKGLDGVAYGDPDEVAAIRFLATHAQPGDVVLEAAGCSYYPLSAFPYNRVAAFSGVPAVIGWGNHERQWRSGQPELTAQIPLRAGDVRQMYADPASPLYAEYGVDWVFIGQYETGSRRPECPEAGPYEIDLARFEAAGWEPAFQSGDVILLHRAQPT
jgi:YYY domain-containing protein